jgi:hypothetical protein
MSDLRDVLERGTGGFDPEAEEALERTLRRAARRSRNRRIAAGAVALSLTVAVVAGLWLAWFGGDRQEEVVPAVNPVEVARIHVGPIEGRPVFGEGRLWVATEDGIQAIDPRTREVQFSVEHVTAPFAVGDGWLWGSMPANPPMLAKVDASSGEMRWVTDLDTQFFGLSPDTPLPPRIPIDVVFHNGRVIVVAEETMVVILDAATDEKTREGWSDDAGEILEMRSIGDALWMRHPEKVSGRAPRVQATFEFPGNRIHAFAPVGREAWVMLDSAARRIALHPPDVDPDSSGPSRIAEFPPVSDAVVADGRLWVVAGAGEGPWNLRAYDLSTGEPAGGSLDLGAGAAPRIAFGAGLLWITDPSGDAVIAVDPSGTTPPDREPEPTEEKPELERGCPPPDVEATWLPPGVSPANAQPGVGGGELLEVVPWAIHYGDSPGPDGGPAPFITIIRTGEHGGPHINAVIAREVGTPVEVLDGEGQLVRIEGGWGAFFLHGEPPCHGYEVTSYGVSRADLRRFLGGLVRGPLTVQPRDDLLDVEARSWDRSDRLSDHAVRVRFLSSPEECRGLARVDVEETPERVIITLFEGSVPGVETCVGLGVLKAVDVRLEAPLSGREIIDGATEGG